jgi:hypothetical protein
MKHYSGDAFGWGFASWYVTLTSDVVFSPLKRTTPDAVIFGNMTMTKGSDGEWLCNTVDLTNGGVESKFTIHRSLLKEQPFLYVVLEIYGVFQCSDLPAAMSTVRYTDMSLKRDDVAFTPQWQIGKSGQTPPTCNSTIDVLSPDRITITFNNKKSGDKYGCVGGCGGH